MKSFFTPMGDLIRLPKGATPVDFAYEVHTQIGSRCIGAKVDGKMVPLNSELKSGRPSRLSPQMPIVRVTPG
jgi:(p)ppGpp synthase/HD superfamily hydrolase